MSMSKKTCDTISKLHLEFAHFVPSEALVVIGKLTELADETTEYSPAAINYALNKLTAEEQHWLEVASKLTDPRTGKLFMETITDFLAELYSNKPLMTPELAKKLLDVTNKMAMLAYGQELLAQAKQAAADFDKAREDLKEAVRMAKEAIAQYGENNPVTMARMMASESAMQHTQAMATRAQQCVDEAAIFAEQFKK